MPKNIKIVYILYIFAKYKSNIVLFCVQRCVLHACTGVTHKLYLI